MTNNTPHLTQNQDFYTAIIQTSPYLNRSDILTAYALIELGHDTGCNAYQVEIAHRAGISTRQVKRCLPKLESVGLIRIDRSRPNHHHYIFCYATVEASHQQVTPESVKDITTEINTQQINSESIPDNLQTALNELGIHPDLTQATATNAPAICCEYTPRQILSNSPAGAIADNLLTWQNALNNGTLDTSHNDRPMTPALIWVKIVEGQAPPLFAESTTDSPDPETLLIASKTAEENNYVDSMGKSTHRLDIILKSLPKQKKGVLGELSDNVSLVEYAPKYATEAPRDAIGDAESTEDMSGIDSEFEQDEMGDIWGAALEIIKTQTTRGVYNRHFSQSRLIVLAEGGYVVICPDELSRQWFEARLAGIVERALSQLTPGPIERLEFTTQEELN